MAFTQPAYDVDNIQGLGDLTKDQAAAVKVLFDKTGADTKTFLIALLAELASVTDGSSGADNIGATAITGLSGTTVQALLESLKALDDSNRAYLLAQIAGVVLGQIPDASLTKAKLAFEPINNIPTAGGIGTALTVAQTGFTLTDGAKVEFIASASNSGAATTINVNSTGVKSIYKPGGTAAPTITAGKAYTIWYDETGGNFFFKASAEGDAVAANVLATKTFSNDNDTGIVGAMPNRAGETAALSSEVSGTTLKLLPSDGYRDGVDDKVTVTDADFVAGNIKNAVGIFGITGNYDAKKYATGTGTTDGSGGLSVAGLTFQPSIIELFFSGNGRYYHYYSTQSTTTFYWVSATNYGTVTVSVNASGFSVTSGFSTSASFSWKAYE